MDTPTCKLCGAELIYQPDHPGKNIGDWWTHPLIRGVRRALRGRIPPP